MRISFTVALAALALSSTTNGLKILMNNDDGFGSGNLRELYKLLKGAGHDVLIVAPAVQQSGQGGRSEFTAYANLTSPAQYNIVQAGAPAVGTDPNDSNIWYYNGTPAACTFVALDYVLPRYYASWNRAPDLFIAGPNYGVNLGPFVYTLSGTLGATYAAVSRSIPGIALSASNDAIPYFNVTNTTNPATWAAKASLKVVQSFIDNTPANSQILPLGYGVNVNIPPLDSDAIPPITKARLTGEAETDIAVFNETTKLFKYGDLRPLAAGVNVCYNGDCELPGETFVVNGGNVSVSLFTIDYTAPKIGYTEAVFAKIGGLFEESGNATKTVKRGMEGRGKILKGRDVSREE
ncbi:survival protein sure-like phosphatase/nucleotidase [Dendryphion nanum]|uniref:Survival protein sure-like phosphatase/nucleotidase n=1 Tax=Dendryphion nanum TaxID=256645 RepID=A0A9P9DQL3_9PLEO|nr:survival protein sure-like phosphatase/nucleotidase [Dendryphion nanum]